MDNYIVLVKTHPMIMAIAQFAILGTFGEVLSKWVSLKKIHLPFSFSLILWKMMIWSILAVCIKYAFLGFHGFVDQLVASSYLPADCLINRSFSRALSISFFMNVQFGLLLVILHRVLDNAMPGQKKNWSGLGKAMLTLLWFWIPAHTVTFMLAKDYQIGLAALWSVALGLILGIFNASESNKTA